MFVGEHLVGYMHTSQNQMARRHIHAEKKSPGEQSPPIHHYDIRLLINLADSFRVYVLQRV
jgi:hypothetical protein